MGWDGMGRGWDGEGGREPLLNQWLLMGRSGSGRVYGWEGVCVCVCVFVFVCVVAGGGWMGWDGRGWDGEGGSRC